MSIGHHFQNKMIVSFDVLPTTVKNGIESKICGGDIITKQANRDLNKNTQVEKELTKPLNFYSSGSSGLILCFSRGTLNS